MISLMLKLFAAASKSGTSNKSVNASFTSYHDSLGLNDYSNVLQEGPCQVSFSCHYNTPIVFYVEYWSDRHYLNS